MSIKLFPQISRRTLPPPPPLPIYPSPEAVQLLGHGELRQRPADPAAAPGLPGHHGPLEPRQERRQRNPVAHVRFPKTLLRRGAAGRLVNRSALSTLPFGESVVVVGAGQAKQLLDIYGLFGERGMIMRERFPGRSVSLVCLTADGGGW